MMGVFSLAPWRFCSPCLFYQHGENQKNLVTPYHLPQKFNLHKNSKRKFSWWLRLSKMRTDRLMIWSKTKSSSQNAQFVKIPLLAHFHEQLLKTNSSQKIFQNGRKKQRRNLSNWKNRIFLLFMNLCGKGRTTILYWSKLGFPFWNDKHFLCFWRRKAFKFWNFSSSATAPLFLQSKKEGGGLGLRPRFAWVWA